MTTTPASLSGPQSAPLQPTHRAALVAEDWLLAVWVAPGLSIPAHRCWGANPQTAVAAIAFLLAFSAVYYAMLVYAPRQVAEREGGLLTWLLRYALFVAGVIFGLAWPRLFGA